MQNKVKFNSSQYFDDYYKHRRLLYIKKMLDDFFNRKYVPKSKPTHQTKSVRSYSYFMRVACTYYYF